MLGGPRGADAPQGKFPKESLESLDESLESLESLENPTVGSNFPPSVGTNVGASVVLLVETQKQRSRKLEQVIVAFDLP